MTNKQIADAKAELNIVPQAREVFGKKYRKFADLVEALRSVNAMKSQFEAESKRLNDELKVYFVDSDHKSVIEGDKPVTLVQSSSSRVDKELLVELGVSTDVITKATKVTYYEYVKP